jgi:hypothetical protein
VICRIVEGAAPAVWQPVGEGSTPPEIRETGKPKESGPIDAGKRLKRPATAEMRPIYYKTRHLVYRGYSKVEVFEQQPLKIPRFCSHKARNCKTYKKIAGS